MFAKAFVANKEENIVTFANLGGTATLVSPRPPGEFAYFQDFLRKGEQKQIRALWRVVSLAFQEELSLAPTKRRWLSTAGGGVPWLHVRIDEWPKYYQHQPYRNS